MDRHGPLPPLSLLWVELCPPKYVLEVLTPAPCECGLIWKQGLCR